jgi:signal transduction histidine kinase
MSQAATVDPSRQLPAIRKSTELADLLDRHQEIVQARWIKEVRALGRPRYRELHDEEVRTFFRAGLAAVTRSLRSGSAAPLVALAEEVSESPGALGSEISEVLEGLLLLRRCLLPLLLRDLESRSRLERHLEALDSALHTIVVLFTSFFASSMSTSLAEERDRVVRLQRATAALLDMRGLDDALEIVCRQALELTGARATGVFLHEEAGGRRLACHCGELDTVQRLAAGDAGDEEAAVTFPLRVKGRALGALTLIEDADRDDDTRPMAALFAHHAAIAIAHALLHERHERLLVREAREKLAQELHDSATQSMYGVTMFAEAATRRLQAGQADDAARLLRELHDTALDALREMRLLVFELRPPILEREGLEAALQARLTAVEARAGLKTGLVVEDVHRLPGRIEDGLYGIAKEALSNAWRHSGATRLSVRLAQVGPEVLLEVVDDGSGFDPAVAQETGGLGLVGMEERAARLGGSLEIHSRPGKGTRVRVEIPITSPAPVDPDHQKLR